MRRFFFIVLCLLLLAACAKQGYPSGGPKDTAPPVAGAAKPQNETRNFNQNQFYVEFDEYVVLKDADNNVLVSPPMKQKPEFTTKGKGILVRIKDTLQPNTTYLFQFKNAIADFTEGNLLPSFDYVFSTGDRMDTMVLGGRVLDARTGKPRSETVTVMAYQETPDAFDTLATSVQPAYVTRCNLQGGFEFHYIQPGAYRLVALEDKNRDLRYAAGEAIAWSDISYAATDSIDTTHIALLRISSPQTTRQRILNSAFVAKGRFEVATQIPMVNPTVSGIEGVQHLNARRDTLTFWCLDAGRDTATIVLGDEGIQDTLKLRMRTNKKGRKRAGQTAPASVEPLMRSLCSGNNAFYDRLYLSFTNPIVSHADSLIADVQNVDDNTGFRCPIELDSTGLRARIATELSSDHNYRIHLRDSLFTDLYGTFSDSLTFTLKPKDFAVLTLYLTNASGSQLVVELLDKRDTVVAVQRVTTDEAKVRFDHLAAGEYHVRAVIDLDADGRWTPGDYLLGRQPEPSVYYAKNLQLREKWEVEERWTVQTPNQ